MEVFVGYLAAIQPSGHAARRFRTLGIALAVVLFAFALYAPAIGSVATRTHGAIIPVRGADGAMLRGTHNSSTSTNWSGYAVQNFVTGQTYTAATGKWVIPTVQAVSGFSSVYSSSWVGIGGDCENAQCSVVDQTLIQLGTEGDVINGRATYDAWYEVLPQAETKTSLVVHPGDTIVASLKVTAQSGSSQTWLLQMNDQTTGKGFSKTLTYASSLLSAEWIQEAPFSGSILPLANYGTITFDPGSINSRANPGLVASDAIVMLNSDGMSSNPSNPDSDTDGFNACWGATHTLTPCSPPVS
jgi:hypothetical protein